MKLETSQIGASVLSPLRQFSRRCRNAADIRSEELSSQQLLQCCLIQNGEVAWREFVRRFQPLIAAVVLKTLRRCTNPNASLISDLVQETYVKLLANNFKALREFDCRHEHALAGFLKVVASNVTQDYLRKVLSQKHGCGKVEDDLEQAVPWKQAAFNSAEQMEQEITLHQVQQFLERELSAPNLIRDCKIFWLYYRDGLTAKAISRRLDIGLSTKGVESAIFRLTNLVRAKLDHRNRNGRHPRPKARSTTISY